VATIDGAATRLNSPDGVLIDAAGDLRVSNAGSNVITIYAPGATGNAAPMASISGSATGLSAPGGMDVNGDGDVAVADFGSSAVAIFGPSSTGNQAPGQTISGAATRLAGPSFVAFTPPPAVDTGPATRIHKHRATLTGSVTPDGSPTAWLFQYRTVGGHVWSSTALTAAGSGGTPIAARVRIRHLRRRTEYRYRLVATNLGGTADGDVRSFTTR
jgi:hypothetical protein